MIEISSQIYSESQMQLESSESQEDVNRSTNKLLEQVLGKTYTIEQSLIVPSSIPKHKNIEKDDLFDDKNLLSDTKEVGVYKTHRKNILF